MELESDRFQNLEVRRSRVTGKEAPAVLGEYNKIVSPFLKLRFERGHAGYRLSTQHTYKHTTIGF